MKVAFFGVRGSTPAPGTPFAGVGGNTSCVALVHHDRGDDVPTLILDAGTGLPGVSALLDGRPFDGTILLSHLHWDHTHGLPFFAAADRPDANTRVLVPAQGAPAAELIAAFMSPPAFPIGPTRLRGAWSFDDLDEGEHQVEQFTVLAREIPHKGGRTFGFRIGDGHGTVAYLSDHGPLGGGGPGPHGWGEYHAAARVLCAGADVLIHDAQYTADEVPEYAPFGHANGEYATELARLAGVGRVLLFHHAPGRTDDQVAAIVTAVRSFSGPGGPAVEAAREGLVIDLGAPVRRGSP